MPPRVAGPDIHGFQSPSRTLVTNPFSALKTKLFPHFQNPLPSQARDRPTYPVGYTRAPMAQPTSLSPDFQTLRSAYDSLTAGGHAPVHFVCNGNDATITKSAGNQFLLRGRATSQPFDVHAKDDTVSMTPWGATGRNGNTGQVMGQEQTQMLVQAAKFALANGYVKSTAFAPDVRMNGL
jgi:hypothetical protein